MYWVPGVNNLGTYGRWGFAEFTEVYQIEADFKAKVQSRFSEMVEFVIKTAVPAVAGDCCTELSPSAVPGYDDASFRASHDVQ